VARSPLLLVGLLSLPLATALAVAALGSHKGRGAVYAVRRLQPRQRYP
jgi:hypothetical protein